MLRAFWKRPREQRWRGWIFRIHLWAGLVIGLWAIVVIAVGGTLYGLVAEFLWHAMDIHIPRIADILARLQDYLP